MRFRHVVRAESMLRTSADVVQFVLGQQARDVEGLGEYPDLVQRIMHVLGVVSAQLCHLRQIARHTGAFSRSPSKMSNIPVVPQLRQKTETGGVHMRSTRTAWLSMENGPTAMTLVQATEKTILARNPHSSTWMALALRHQSKQSMPKKNRPLPSESRPEPPLLSQLQCAKTQSKLLDVDVPRAFLENQLDKRLDVPRPQMLLKGHCHLMDGAFWKTLKIQVIPPRTASLMLSGHTRMEDSGPTGHACRTM